MYMYMYVYILCPVVYMPWHQWSFMYHCNVVSLAFSPRNVELESLNNEIAQLKLKLASKPDPCESHHYMYTYTILLHYVHVRA